MQMDLILSKLKHDLPCRSHQIEQLYNLFAYKDEDKPPCVYIYGSASTGKSIVVTSVLKQLNIKHAVINLIECYTSKILFETILNKLSGHKINPKNGDPYVKCDNMMDFISHLHKCCKETDLNRSVLIIDKAEELRNMDSNLLPIFLRFTEVTRLPISVLLLSEIIFEKYHYKSNIIEPIKFCFPQYNREELLQILLLDIDKIRSIISTHYNASLEFDVDFYKNYLGVFLSVFYRACRDVSELRHMARLNFIKYCQPVVNGITPITDSMNLWRNVAPILKSSLEVLYLRISLDHSYKNKTQTPPAHEIEKQYKISGSTLAQSLELPYYAKYLLIAAYLASYNPAKEDKRLFMKYHGKKRKTMKDVKAKSKVSEQLATQLGPKPFTFDRLLAIFYAILDDKIGFNNNLLVQVSSLVELQLLSAISDKYCLDGQKYKCNVNFDFIQTFAKMVGFNIRKYLYDYSHI